MGKAKKLVDPLGLADLGKGTGYNSNDAMNSQIATARAQAKYGTYGINSILGNMNLVENADGTYSLNYQNSDADNLRQNLINQGLSNLSLDPTSAQSAYYKQATRQLLPQFQQDQDRLHEQLVNRGITAGSSLYNDQMGKLRDSQQGTLADISNQAVYQGQDYLSSQIGNIGSLANQYDALKVGSLGGQTGANFSDPYNTQQQIKAQNNSAKWGAIGNLAGAAIGAFAASDARLKENIEPVGKLDNGLTVYLFNFKGDKKKQIGLIAQEVAEVIPDAVIEGEDGYLRVDYEKATKGGK